jgi:hypothetical protein
MQGQAGGKEEAGTPHRARDPSIVSVRGPLHHIPSSSRTPRRACMHVPLLRAGAYPDRSDRIGLGWVRAWGTRTERMHAPLAACPGQPWTARGQLAWRPDGKRHRRCCIWRPTEKGAAGSKAERRSMNEGRDAAEAGIFSRNARAASERSRTPPAVVRASKVLRTYSQYVRVLRVRARSITRRDATQRNATACPALVASGAAHPYEYDPSGACLLGFHSSTRCTASRTARAAGTGGSVTGSIGLV